MALSAHQQMQWEIDRLRAENDRLRGIIATHERNAEDPRQIKIPGLKESASPRHDREG